MSTVAPRELTVELEATASNAAVLVVEDDAGLRAALCDTLAIAGYPAISVADGKAALAALHDHGPGQFGLVVSDVQMAPMDGLELLYSIREHQLDVPVLLMTAFGSVQQAVEAMHVGAVDYLVKPFEAEVLASKVSRYCLPLQGADDRHGQAMIGVAPASVELAALAARVAHSDVTVMVSGESGTGKEVLARFIHRESGRSEGPFIGLNCAAIPDNMLEAMLFGYERGAFTGAHKACPGKFEQAEGGTLLLDEISEMALGLQAKLLRVLQEREVERLGGRSPVKLDVRVIATTNRDLHGEVDAGRFREDLYYRLNVFPLHLSPLRERPADVAPLAKHLLARAAPHGSRGRTLTASAAHKLGQYLWPGNVRELDNVIQRALVLCRASEVDAGSIVFEGARCSGLNITPDDATESESLGDELRHGEFRLIRDALSAGNGSRKAVAEKLGISERTLRYKLARMRDAGIEV